VAILSYVDRQIFTLFQDDIKAELKISDGQLGLLTGWSFAAFYAIAAFPIARYADRGDRRLVVALCVMVWSAATALCCVANSFWQMVLARIGLAAGEAGAGPASISLLTEIFPPERRTLVISSMLSASAIGISGGLWLAGGLSRYFGWRDVFLIIGLPGIILGLAIWLLSAEPRRGSGEVVTPPAQINFGEVFSTMARNVSLRWVGLLLMMVPVSGFSFIIWGASFFQRVHGLSKGETGFWLGTAMALGLVFGNVVAGWVADRWGKDNPRFNGWFAGLGLLAAFPLALVFIWFPNPYVALGAFVFMNFLMTLHLGPIIALSFVQVPVAMRAMISATINLIIGLAGTGVGGTMTGVLSQVFAASYGSMSLRPALSVLSCCLIVGGIAAIMAGRTAKPLEA
jgi:predicted MFS family arabinose efflux permease